MGEPKQRGRPPKIYKQGQFGSEDKVGQIVHPKNIQVEQKDDTIGLNFTQIVEPNDYEEAMTGPQAELWREAIDDDLQTLEKQKTWEVVNIPSEKRILQCK